MRFLLLLVMLAGLWSADMPSKPYDCAQNARGKLVSMILGSRERTTALQSAMTAMVSKYSLASVNVATFGFLANADGDNMVAITNGSTALTSTTGRWKASDAGRTIHVAGAGVAGATLTTTIAAYVSAGAVTLTDAASTTVAPSVSSAGGVAVWGDPVSLTLAGDPLKSGLDSLYAQSLNLTSLPTATVTSTGGSTARTLANRFADQVWVEDFGAKGDGSTDDTAAIQAAITTGKRVRFRPLTYSINGVTKLDIPSNSCIEMDKNTVLQVADHGASNAYMFWVASKSNVSISGGTIKGNRTSTGIGVGIFLAGSTDIWIDNVRVENWRTDGLILSADGSNNPSERVYVTGCRFNNQYRNGASVTSARNFVFTGCVFSNTNGASPEAGLDIEPDNALFAHTGTLAGCIFFGNYGDGLKVQAGMGGGSYSQDITITGCVSRGNIVNGITVNAVPRVSISNTVCFGNVQDGLSISAGSSDVAVSAVTVSGNGRHGLVSAGVTGATYVGVIANANSTGYGIILGTHTDCLVDGVARNNGIHGIYLDTCTNVSLRATCTGNAGNGVAVNAGAGISVGGVFRSNTGFGVSTAGALDRYTITGAIYQGNTAGQIQDSASGVNKSITGNVSG